MGRLAPSPGLVSLSQGAPVDLAAVRLVAVAFRRGAVVLRKKPALGYTPAVEQLERALGTRDSSAEGCNRIARYILAHGLPVPEAERWARRAVEAGGGTNSEAVMTL